MNFVRKIITKAMAALMLIILIAACSEKRLDEIASGEILDMSDEIPNGLVLGQRWEMSSDKLHFVHAKMQELDDTTGKHVASITLYLYDKGDERDKDFDNLSLRLMDFGKGSEISTSVEVGERVVAMGTDEAITITYVRCQSIVEIAFDRTYEGPFGLNEFTTLAQKLDQKIIFSLCP